jgi:tetratricopeptide (TPR) repeat protein
VDQVKNRKKIAYMAMSALLLTACNSPEEVAQSHLQKGKELFEKGEFDKAILELKTSSQDNDQRGETYYYMALLDEKNKNFKSMRQNLLKTIELDPGFQDARIKLGKVHVLFGDLEKALEQAETVLTANPANTEAQVLKASVFVRQNKNDDAAQIIETVLKGNPDNVDALSLKAAQEYERNNVESALSLLNKALEKDNKNVPLRLFKIKINAKRKNVDAMVDDYKELITSYPDNDDFKLSLASLYSMTDKLQPAEELLREMADKKQDKVEPKVVLLEFLNAKAKDRVIGEYEQLIVKHKQQASQVAELSKWMLASGYVDSASKGLQQVVDLEKDSKLGLTAQTLLAEIALSKKQYDVVETAVDRILKANSDFVDASLVKARLFLVQNKVDQAIELLNKAIWTKNDSDNAYLLLGQAYAAKKDRKQADKSFKQALEINPANLGAFIPVFGTYLQANQKENARQFLEKALARNPNQVLLLTNKADLDILEKKWDDAQETVQRIALFSKNKAVPLYLQANILQGKGQYSEAIALYEKLLEEFPDHLNSMVNLARSFEALKAHDKAVAYLEAHHVKHPDNLIAVGVLGDLYAADGDFAKAKQLLTNQLKQMPKSVPLYLALAKIETSLRKSIDGAKDVYLNGLENNPDDPQLLMALAGVYEQTGDKLNARKIYEKLLDKNPETDLAINNLASLLIDSGSADDANKGLLLAEKFKDFENPYFQDTYAWALIKAGKTSEGLKLLESLIVKEPKLAELRYHLGVAHFNSGNMATARAELKQAIALAEKQQRNFSGKDEATKLLKEIEHSAK